MYVRVLVTPDAKKEKVISHSDIEFEIAVKEPAERNLANRRVRELVADIFRLEVGKIKIISGHHSRKKVLSVEKDAVS